MEDGKRCDKASRWVKVTQVPPMTEDELKEDLENMTGLNIRTCQEHSPLYLVEAATDEGVKALLLLNNVEVLPGRRIRIVRYEDPMTAKAIIDFISNRLHHRLKWTTPMASSARPPTPTSQFQGRNTPPRGNGWREWPQEEEIYWQPSGGNQQRSRSQPPLERFPQNPSQGPWRQNRPQDPSLWRNSRGFQDNQWGQERRLSFSSQEGPTTPRGNAGKAQWPKEVGKGGGQPQPSQSSSSGRGPPPPQVVQAIQDQSQPNTAATKGKGDYNLGVTLGRAKASARVVDKTV